MLSKVLDILSVLALVVQAMLKVIAILSAIIVHQNIGTRREGKMLNLIGHQKTDGQSNNR